jgi:hypothetical protein
VSFGISSNYVIRLKRNGTLTSKIEETDSSKELLTKIRIKEELTILL